MNPAPVFPLMGDGAAQWLMSTLTLIGTIVSAIAVWLVWKSLEATNKALAEAKDANSIARKIGEAQVRAYIGRKCGGVWKGEGVEFALEIANTGNSPAFDINIVFEFMYEGARIPIGDDPRFYRVDEQFFYAGPFKVTALGAGESLTLDNSSFVGFHSESGNANIDAIAKASIGIFATDIFGGEILYFDGVGVFKDREEYQERRNILPLSAPMGHFNHKLRIRSWWGKLDRRIKNAA